MWLERISGGDTGLIDLLDARNFLRILNDENDAEIVEAIASASAFLEVDEDGFGGIGLPIVAQQWSLKKAGFGKPFVRLPFARVVSVDNVHFYSPDGHLETIAPNDYQLIKHGRLWSVCLSTGKNWPSAADRPDAVEVLFTAGWPEKESVPGDIKAAARLLTEFFFETRALEGEQDIPKRLAQAIDNLTIRYRRFGI